MIDLRHKRVSDLIEALRQMDPCARVWTMLEDGDIDLCVGDPWDKLERIMLTEVGHYVLDDEYSLEELKEEWNG